MMPEATVSAPGNSETGTEGDRSLAADLALLLGGSERTFERIRAGRDLATVVRTALLTIVIGAAIFGGAIGCFRGGIQILYAGVKLPLVLLLTTAASAPALTALGVALGRTSDLRRDIALVLTALARTSLTLVGLTPLVLLAVRRDADYHDVVLLLVAACGLAGGVGLVHFFRGLRSLDTRAILSTGLALLAVFTMVGSQMSWTLRPFLVRPRAVEVPFVRSLEGGFLDSLRVSARSAAGIYSRKSAPLPGESDHSHYEVER